MQTQSYLPSDITVAADGSCGANVDIASLASVSSTDCDNVAVSQDINRFNLGTTEVTVTATGSDNAEAHCHTHVTIVDNTNPTLSAPPDTQIECDVDSSPQNTGVATTTDNCGSTVSHTDVVMPGTCPQENNIFRTWTAIDGSGNSVSHTQHVHVVDFTPPVQHQPKPTCLWPPNHKFKCFADATSNFVTGQDNCGLVNVRFNNCTSSQPANGLGDGNFLPDCFYEASNDHLCFRAERQGSDKNGRTYGASFTAVDQCGNTAPFARTVFVPHDEDTFDTTKCVAGTLKLDNQNGNANSKGKGKK